MPRRAEEVLRRWLPGSRGLGLIAVAFALPHFLEAGPEPPRAHAAAQENAPGFDALYQSFGAALERVRAGEDDAIETLLDTGERLAREHGRADALEVARFYAVLDREARIEGWRLDQEYRQLWKELIDANKSAPPLEEWDIERVEIEEDLERLVDRALGRPDFTPAARALSLLAILQVERVERDRRLVATERDDLLRRAEGCAERSLVLLERAGLRTPALEPTWVLARVDRARGRLSLARELYASLAELAIAQNQPAWRAKGLRGLADLAFERGDLDETNRLLRELARTTDPTRDWYLARRHAQGLFVADLPAEALEFLQGARPQRGHPLDEWRMLAGSALLRLGEHDRARALYAELSEDAALDRDLALAALDLREGDVAGALARLEALELDRERDDVRARTLVWLGEGRLASGDPAGAVRALEEALAAAELWRVRFESGSEARDPVVNVHGEVLGLHAVVLLALARAELGQGLAAAAAIEAGQGRSFASRSGEEPAALEGQLLAWAAANPRGLVTWAIGADTSVVAHVAANGDAASWPLPYGRRAIASAVRRLRERALDGPPDQLLAMAREVRAALFPPELESRLAVGPGESLEALFLLHGPLEELPLELLLELEPGAGSLVPRVLPGLPAPEPGPPIAGRALQAWSLAGDPLLGGDSTWPTLPGARAELADLVRLHPGSVLTSGAEFDRSALEEAFARGSSLHVATHLVPACEDGPARLAGIGLVLSGGETLCPGEIREAAPALPLVVLSGCESQGGRWIDAEGLLGTARAFLESGTRNLVVTLWPVEDAAARQAAVAFHQALLAGLGPARAAQAAREDLRRTGHGPADWAAFRLLGRD